MIFQIISICSLLIYVNRSTLNTRYCKLKTVLRLVLSDDFDCSTSIQLFHNDTLARIKYSKYGKNYSIVVPYRNNIISRMLRFEAFLCVDDQQYNITHQPGIPYLYSPQQLGGDKIIFKYRDGTIKQFDHDQIPSI